ncbi:galactosyldiacylglycerol synthase [Pseudonocardia ailaonensis]|uniref:Galactosyldiacylglycerol synthase n=1 Tax=Pseudonocardia ailaonensis TaxID=367279 RepID=A0ABN2N2W0_9PSEU
MTATPSDLLARRRSRRAGPPGRVVVVGATVGQGHEGAARELARRLRRTGVWVKVHDYVDALPGPVARTVKDLYAPSVRYTPRLFDGLFRGLEHPGVLRSVTEWACGLAADRVEAWTGGADVVVSTYPLASRTLGELRRAGRLPATTVSYLTDPAAHAFWCHPEIDLHLTVTSATALDARRYGVPARASGPLCAPRFGDTARRAAVRGELEIPLDAPFVLLSAGSLGMGDVPETVEAITRHPRAHAVVLCARNTGLRRALASRPRVVALGWRDDVPDLMAAADVLVHNAGGLSFTEALVAGLPAVTYRPIPGHGRANAAVLAAAGIAAWPRTPDELAAEIERLHGRPRAQAHPWPPDADPAEVVRGLLPAALENAA